MPELVSIGGVCIPKEKYEADQAAKKAPEKKPEAKKPEAKKKPAAKKKVAKPKEE